MARYYGNRKAIRNRYAIRCNYCGCTVAAGEGKVWKYRGRWIGAHHKGCCPTSEPVEKQVVLLYVPM